MWSVVLANAVAVSTHQTSLEMMFHDAVNTQIFSEDSTIFSSTMMNNYEAEIIDEKDIEVTEKEFEHLVDEMYSQEAILLDQQQ